MGVRTKNIFVLFLIAVTLLTPSVTMGAPAKKTGPKQELNIPKQTTAPPTFVKKAPPDLFKCGRSFVYEGQVLSCDSNLYSDGEGLRSILESSPAAISELNIYQENRRTVQLAAYTSTFGLGLALTGLLISRFMTDENGRMSGEGRVVRNVAAISGLSISAMSVVLGLSILGTNERHLHNSVQLYNETNPGHPIELQITASTPLW